MSDLLPYGPLIAEHCILSAGLEPGRCPAAQPLGGEEGVALVGSVRAWEAWLDACEDSSEPPQGYILTKPGSGQQAAAAAAPDGEAGGAAAAAGAAGAAGAAAGAVYEEFEPVLLRQHAHKPALAFPTFDAALGEFFGKAAGQRAAAAAAAKEKAAVGKLDAIRKDHEKRLGSLEKEAEAAQLKVGWGGDGGWAGGACGAAGLWRRRFLLALCGHFVVLPSPASPTQAALIEYNLEAVDAALNAVREAVASGMDWRDLARMIKVGRGVGGRGGWQACCRAGRSGACFAVCRADCPATGRAC